MELKLAETLSIYNIPSQAIWRAFELEKLEELKSSFGFNPPILDIGCGDGLFSSMIFDKIDDGIDINMKSVTRCRIASCQTYKNVYYMDARSINLPSESYQTIFANCVLEHIAEVDRVIFECYRLLKYNGKLIMTVPLVEMNRHLMFSGSWYIKMRQRQLSHINLFGESEWKKLLSGIGFRFIASFPYLPGSVCLLWDILDVPVCLGYSRFKVSAAVRMVVRALPHKERNFLLKELADLFKKYLDRCARDSYCASVIIATK